jgi:hypothetical protein
MNRPVSSLYWMADPVTPHAIRLRWLAAPWDYVVYWGDATSAQVPVFGAPVWHEYPRAGTYDVSCVAHIGGRQITIAGKVTIRDFALPAASFELLPDQTTVRASLGSVDEPVDYRVTWRPGHTSRHGADDLNPTHEYPSGFGSTRIEVADLPSRRRKRFDGPTIPDGPPPGGRFAWHGGLRGTLRGASLPAGKPLHIRFSYSTEDDFRDAVVAPDGTVAVDFAYTTEVAGGWSAIHVFEKGKERGEPYHIIPLALGDKSPLGLWYTWREENPQLIRIGVQSPQQGRYLVDWGDSHSEVVTCDGIALLAEHPYDGFGPYTIKVVDSTGTEDERRIMAPEVKRPTWGTSGIDGRPNGTLWTGIESWDDSFAPLRPRWGPYRKDWSPEFYQMLMGGYLGRTTGHSYDMREHGGKSFSLLVSRPLAPAAEFGVTIPFDPKKEHDMNPPMRLVAGGYARPGDLVDVRLLHVPEGVTDVQLRSAAFLGGVPKVYELDLIEDPESATRRTAHASIEIDPEAPVNAVVPVHIVTIADGELHQSSDGLWIDAIGPDTPLVVSLIPIGKPDPTKGQYTSVLVGPLGRNVAKGYLSTEIPPCKRDTEFELTATPGVGSASCNINVKDAAPNTYRFWVREVFAGGHEERREGTYTVQGSVTARELFPVIRMVDIPTLPPGDVTKVFLEFDQDHHQPNIGYTVLWEDPELFLADGSKAPDDEFTRQLIAAFKPYGRVRRTNGVYAKLRVPDAVKGNDRIRTLKLRALVAGIGGDDGVSAAEEEEGELLTA